MKKLWILSALLVLTGCTQPQQKPLTQEEKVPEHSLFYFVTVDTKSDLFDASLVPAGSGILECGSYIVRRRQESIRSNSFSEVVSLGLTLTLTKENDITTPYINPFVGTGTTLDKVVESDAGMEIWLRGSIEGDACQVDTMKALLEHTAHQLSGGQEIIWYLNESQEEWYCSNHEC
jgi:hypothetical protein